MLCDANTQRVRCPSTAMGCLPYAACVVDGVFPTRFLRRRRLYYICMHGPMLSRQGTPPSEWTPSQLRCQRQQQQKTATMTGYLLRNVKRCDSSEIRQTTLTDDRFRALQLFATIPNDLRPFANHPGHLRPTIQRDRRLRRRRQCRRGKRDLGNGSRQSVWDSLTGTYPMFCSIPPVWFGQ
jgi:hypothetical protein